MNKKGKDNPRKTSRIVGYIVSFLCLFLCLFIVIEVIVANVNNRPPRVLGYSISYVPTRSMEPTIMAGDYVLYKKASFDDVEVDDIIVYKNSDDVFVIHRVVEKFDSYLICQGDNNPIEDSDKIIDSMIFGKYIKTIGILSIFSGGISKNLIFLVIVLIFIVMIVMQVISIVIKNKTEKIKHDACEERKLMLEQLKQEILKEELAKLKEKNKDN